MPSGRASRRSSARVRRAFRGRRALLPRLQAAARATATPARSPATVSERHERARKVKPQLAEGELVEVAWARNQAEGEFIQGLLLEEGVPSMLRRSAGFDVPDFLAAGPRDVMVPDLRCADRPRGPAPGRADLGRAGGPAGGARAAAAGLLVALAIGALLVWLLSLAIH